MNHLCESSNEISCVNHLCEKLLCLLASVCDVLKPLSHPDNIYYACCDAAIAEMPPKRKKPAPQRSAGIVKQDVLWMQVYWGSRRWNLLWEML